MELYYYLLLSLGVTATFANARLFVKIAVAFIAVYFVLLVLHETDLIQMNWGRPFFQTTPHSIFYRTFLGITVFFALGGLAYHLKKINVSPRWRAISTALILLLPFLDIGGFVGQIVCYLLFGIGTAAIIRMWPDERPTGFLRFLGDMSYPLFLVHWPIAVFVTATMGLIKNTPIFLLVAGTFSLFAAAALVLVLERPIAGLRLRVRSRNLTVK